MGLFDFFKKQPKFQDEVFGLLTYNVFKDNTKNFYSGDILFQGFLIGITIDAKDKGPSQLQKDFFKKLTSDYKNIKDEIILPFLQIELEDTIEESGLANFDTEFELDGISIGYISNQKTEWSVTYDSKPMRHFVTIDFDGMTPKDMMIDG
ncbi:hypothetical protein FFWV33_10010 [Flavobacterium faecale]|uniref:DUF2262 domain-containing protein n=1 Tax=Flavobacterium faecale TaxID=1355330 RepID=A0A2S1LDL0_9FLAO|nr:hypothetical protein [Flavobacterium faecale]AWG21843.1 hypothetical protein FFWV33_10010 [Flavobacterium faecale]